jgi:hypothetical protein
MDIAFVNKIFTYITTKRIGVLVACTLLQQCIAKNNTDFVQNKNNITMRIHQLSGTEMRKLLNSYNPIKITRFISGYYALEIMIENQTAREYVLAQNNINLDLTNNVTIQQKIKTSPIIFPFFTALTSSLLLISGIGFAIVPSVIVGLTLGITALNLNTQKTNNFSIKYIRNKMINACHPTLIAEFSKIQKIIFIKTKNMKNRFSITLESLDGKKKQRFNVLLDLVC